MFPETITAEWLIATFDESVLRTAVAKLNVQRRTKMGIKTGPPVVLHACRHCHKKYAAYELQLHEPKCSKNPNRRTKRGRPAILRPCPHCHKEMGSSELVWHKPRCAENPRIKAAARRYTKGVT